MPHLVERRFSAKFLFLFDPHRVKALHGGRGGGKSHVMCEVAILAAMQRRIRVVCGREFMVSIAQSMRALLVKKIEDMGVRDRFRITETEIECTATGSLFFFVGLGRNIANLKGIESCDIFIGDEANAFSQASLDYLFPTMRKPGSELWFAWNPTKETDPIEFLRRAPPTDSVVREVSWRDNPWFRLSPLHQDMLDLKARDELKWRHVYGGEFERRADAQVFKHWRVDRLVVPESTSPLFGCDWGFSVDPLALTKSYLLDGGRILYVEAEAGRVGVTIEQTPALFDTVPGTRVYATIADNARPELIAHMNANGFRVEAAMKGPNSVKDGVAWLQAREIVVNPACTNVIRELRDYAWKVDRDGTVLPDLVDADNHWIDALRYSVEPERKPRPTFGVLRF